MNYRIRKAGQASIVVVSDAVKTALTERGEEFEVIEEVNDNGMNAPEAVEYADLLSSELAARGTV